MCSGEIEKKTKKKCTKMGGQLTLGKCAFLHL